MKGCVIIPKHVGFTHTTSDQDDKVEQISFGLSVIFDGRNFDTSFIHPTVVRGFFINAAPDF